jgi:hypothetical protein
MPNLARAHTEGTSTAPPPDGVVRITPQSGGKYLVEIGRGKYVKRFQLSHAEASELYSQLAATVPGLRPAS